MTPTGYTEDALIEQPAIELLKSLGWEYYNTYGEFDTDNNPLGRETKSEVVLTKRLWSALTKLNPDAPAEAIGQTVDVLARDRSRMSLAAANREICEFIKNGVRTN